MASTAERDVKNYLVDDATMDQFNNITRFAKNLILKDSKKYEDAESSLSRFMGDMLIKYADRGLTYDDIKKLLETVDRYNDIIDKSLKIEDNPNNENAIENFKSLCYGIDKSNIDKENSLAHLIYDIIRYDEFDIPLTIEDIKKLILDTETIKDESKLSDRDKEILNHIKAKNITSDNLQNEKDVLIKKEYIQSMFIEQNGEIEKLKASEAEKQFILAGCQYIFFDLKFDLNKITNYSSILINNDAKHIHLPQSTNKNTTDESKYVSVLIFYKELNPKYREDIDAEINEIVLNEAAGSSGTVIDKILAEYKTNSNIYDSITASMVNAGRTVSSPILIRDFYDETESNIIKTTKLFKYRYTNAYIARKAAESEIISYCYGDPYISNLYGRFIYQRNEIKNFLSIFQEVHDYFYRVLLNESFIHDDYYKQYEKLFLIFWSIERFISSKVDNSKNIDYFDMNDVKNFLESYGMSDLSEIIDVKNFLNSETLSKNLIKNFIGLNQNKGSRAVIDVLEKVFTINEGELDIQKALSINKNAKNEIKNTVEFEDGDGKILLNNGRIYNTDDNFREANPSTDNGRSYSTWSRKRSNALTDNDDSIFKINLSAEKQVIEFGNKEVPVPIFIQENVKYSAKFQENNIDIILTKKSTNDDNLDKKPLPEKDFPYLVKKKTEETPEGVWYWYLNGKEIIEATNISYETTCNVIRFISEDGINYIAYPVSETYNKPITGIIKNIKNDDKKLVINTDSYYQLNKDYSILTVPYSETNARNSIIGLIDNAVPLPTFVEEDKYWDINDTTDEILSKFDFSHSNTKYLVPELKFELSKTYYMTRIFFAIVEWLHNKDIDIEVPTDLVPSNTTTTLYDIVQVIKYEYTKLNYKENIENILVDTTFRMPTDLSGILKYGINYIASQNEYIDSPCFDIEIINSAKGKEDEFTGGLSILEKINRGYQTEDGNKKYANSDDFKNNIESIMSAILYIPDLIINGYKKDVAASSASLSMKPTIRSSTYNEFLMKLFNDLFIQHGNNLKPDLYNNEQPSNIDGIDSQTDLERAEMIVALCNVIKERFKSVPNFSIGFNDNSTQNNLLTFLQATIEYFISYTSTIYKSSIIHEYNNQMETLDITDKIEINVNTSMMDSFYYDESLNIERNREGIK